MWLIMVRKKTDIGFRFSNLKISAAMNVRSYIQISLIPVMYVILPVGGPDKLQPSRKAITIKTL